MTKLNNSGWKRRISLVLVFTMLFSVFMHQGWYRPKTAQAVTIGNSTTMVRPTGGTGTTGPLTITNANWSCGAGTNRLLVITVTGEGATGALNSFDVTANKGTGINFTEAANTTASRTAAYIGYLTEAQITASGTNSIIITAPGTATGFDASVACYSNVDQNNPILATSIVEGDTAATTTASFSVSAVNQGMVVLAFADATAQAINSSTWTGYTAVSNAGTAYQTHALYKAITVNGTESGTFTRTTSARYGIVAVSLRPLADFTVGNGTSLGNMNVGPSTTNNALDGFTMNMLSSSGTVTGLVVTGSANFTATNIPTNGVKVWRDLGTVGVYDAGVDVQISTASTAIASNATTVAISNESVTTTAQNYLVTVDMTAGATLTQSFTGTITSASGTGLGTTIAYNDTSSANLTVATPNLTVGNGTNPYNKNAQLSSTNNELDGFSMATTGSTTGSTVTSLTITGNANFTATNIPTNGVKVWLLTGAGKSQISTASTAISGNATTVTISSESVTNTAKNYLVTVDITAGATLTNTITATVTGAGGTNIGTPVYNDSISATLTINKLPSNNAACSDCHGYTSSFTDGIFRNSPTGMFIGDHNTHVVKIGAACSICHVAPASTGSADYGHRVGTIQMQATINGGSYSKASPFAQINNPTTGTCSNISCHGANNPSPTWGVGTAGCVDCHNGIISAPTASTVSGGTVTQRDNVISEFGLAWGHKKSGRGTVANADCIVCHLEGDYSTQKTSSKHMDGNIDLRDPDGSGETPITNNSGGVFTFATYSISYNAGARTTSLGNTVPEVIAVKFCMKCHDSNGAINPTARSNNGGTGTQYMPFGGIALGSSYTGTNGAIGTQGLINVTSQFTSTNSSRHPVGAPNSRAYPYSTRLVAPYNNIGTTRDSNTLAANTASPRVKANSVVLVCDDCHTVTTVVGSSPSLVNRTITAHGNAVSLRGTYFTSSPTLCLGCHGGLATVGTTTTYMDTNGDHNNGSALSTGNNNIGTGIQTCHNCHFSSQTAPARPIKAADVHGFNGMLATGGTWTFGAANGMRPVAFIRNSGWTTTSPRPYVATGITAGASSCGGTTSASIGSCGSQTHDPYYPGGSY